MAHGTLVLVMDPELTMVLRIRLSVIKHLASLGEWSLLVAERKCLLDLALIPFDKPESVAQVLNHHFWRFKGMTITMERWFVSVNLSLIRILALSVKELGIPTHAWARKVFNLVASKCGKLVDIDWFTTARLSLGILHMKIYPTLIRKVPT
ncbi:hypothetical protein AMTR_s00033p00024810 [Amborella trichopoda]|uniref:Uncharacterized protein n=1 Tax=Amborella trichopoda TaxID=13333 RepID=U5CM25_AMBTC|nr:hypothetical protein AMTR_s00033p00024810 [Amborella trichopoda]